VNDQKVVGGLNNPVPPRALRIPLSIKAHGHERVDDYAWLRDANWQKFIDGELDFADPRVKEYLDAENVYQEAVLADTALLRKTLYDEILSRIQESDESYPVKKGEWYFSVREEEGKNYPIYCRRHLELTAPAQVYFDVNVEAEGHALFIMGPSQTNPSCSYLAYTYNLTGSMERTLRIRDLATGKDLDWEIADTNGDFEWIDDSHLYYVERDESARGSRVFKLNIHQGVASAQLVFEKSDADDSMFLSLSQTTDRQFVSVTLASGSSQAIFVAQNGAESFELFVRGFDDVVYDLESRDGCFYILTNESGARDFKIMQCATRADGWHRSAWVEWLPERRGRCLVSHDIYNRFVIVTEKNNATALEELCIYDLVSAKLHKQVEIPQAVYELTSAGNWDPNAASIRLFLDSPVMPMQTLDLDLDSARLTVLKTKSVPNFDSSRYELRREYARARDGQDVPLTIVVARGTKLDSSNPVYLYGYGSYGHSMDHHFSGSVFSLVDRGFMYCVAHIRGGSDKGYDWYLDGKMNRKMNTFFDFIDAAEHLIGRRYCSAGQIAIRGGSAGGLLVAAVANMRPELFGAVVAEVPFVDVINTISDSSLPLTPPEWEEWGNPIESKSDFYTIMHYSPYDNVKRQAYPSMLFVAGISDEQVTYWESAKMVAKLREYKTDNNLLLLHMKMHSGHSGASKRYERIEESAFAYGFILKALSLVHRAAQGF
jgi:oligopeptidase B